MYSSISWQLLPCFRALPRSQPKTSPANSDPCEYFTDLLNQMHSSSGQHVWQQGHFGVSVRWLLPRSSHMRGKCQLSTGDDDPDVMRPTAIFSRYRRTRDARSRTALRSVCSRDTCEGLRDLKTSGTTSHPPPQRRPVLEPLLHSLEPSLGSTLNIVPRVIGLLNGKHTHERQIGLSLLWHVCSTCIPYEPVARRHTLAAHLAPCREISMAPRERRLRAHLPSHTRSQSIS